MRSIKDYNYYIDEANTLSEKVDQLKIDGGSEHYINKQTEVMQESLDMIPHVSHQLKFLNSKFLEQILILNFHFYSAKPKLNQP